VTQQDIQLLLDSVLSGVKDAVVFDSVVVSKKLLQTLKTGFKSLMQEKASKVSSLIFSIYPF